MYLSKKVTSCLHDTIVALMSFLHTSNFCAMMIWPVSIDLPVLVRQLWNMRFENVCVTDDFANHLHFHRIHAGWVANHHLRLGRHIASSAVAVTSRWSVLWKFPSVPSLSSSLHLDVKSQVVQILQSPFPRQNSISPSSFDRFTSAPLLSRRFSAN